MSYSNNELAEADAMKHITAEIIGDPNKYTFSQLKDLSQALEENQEDAVDREQYHLADVFKEAREELLTKTIEL